MKSHKVDGLEVDDSLLLNTDPKPFYETWELIPDIVKRKIEREEE